MIFDFTLDPIGKVQPWGKDENSNIHWFALTQGKYRLKVGSEYLLNYTDEFIQYLSEKYPQYTDPKTTFTDYYVVRLWENILDILPFVLETVPQKLRHLLESDYENYQFLQKRAEDWRESETAKGRDQDETSQIVDSTVFWLNERWLDSAYLSPSAGIWVWSDETDVIISWDNSGIEIEGISVWTATQGNHRIGKDVFVKEVCEFSGRLLDEMNRRIESICRNWKNNQINIDCEELKSEQKARARILDLTLKSSPKTDWSRVIFAVNKILN